MVLKTWLLSEHSQGCFPLPVCHFSLRASIQGTPGLLISAVEDRTTPKEVNVIGLPSNLAKTRRRDQRMGRGSAWARRRWRYPPLLTGPSASSLTSPHLRVFIYISMMTEQRSHGSGDLKQGHEYKARSTVLGTRVCSVNVCSRGCYQECPLHFVHSQLCTAGPKNPHFG